VKLEIENRFFLLFSFIFFFNHLISKSAVRTVVDFAVIEVDPDAWVTNGLVQAAVSSVAHVSSLSAHNYGLLGNHVDGPARGERLLFAAQISVHSKVSFRERLASVSYCKNENWGVNGNINLGCQQWRLSGRQEPSPNSFGRHFEHKRNHDEAFL